MSDRRALQMKGVGVAAAAIGIASLGFLAGRSSPVDVLARSYGTSLEQISSDWTGTAPVAGENLWLSRAEAPPRAIRKALTIGDRINIGNAAGRSDAYEVTTVELIEADVLGTPNSLIQIVTGRVDGSPNAATVRFIFAIEAPATAPETPRPEKVL